jgi:hypothetical protein
MKLLGIDTNHKTVKGQKLGYMTGIMYLSPSTMSGKNFCPNASKGCKAVCLNTAGRGQMTMVQKARLAKSIFFIDNKQAFVAQLKVEIAALVKRANKNGFIPTVRLNGTSDLPFENMGIMQAFPDVQFYDYTASPKRAIAYINGEMPSNYHLTFSRKESNHAQAELIAKMGGNVAVVFTNLPDTYLGNKVIDGDKSDLRFLDDKGVVVGLKAKGKAKKDQSGFVVLN